MNINCPLKLTENNRGWKIGSMQVLRCDNLSLKLHIMSENINIRMISPQSDNLLQFTHIQGG